MTVTLNSEDRMHVKKLCKQWLEAETIIQSFPDRKSSLLQKCLNSCRTVPTVSVYSWSSSATKATLIDWLIGVWLFVYMRKGTLSCIFWMVSVHLNKICTVCCVNRKTDLLCINDKVWLHLVFLLLVNCWCYQYLFVITFCLLCYYYILVEMCWFQVDHYATLPRSSGRARASRSAINKVNMWNITQQHYEITTFCGHELNCYVPFFSLMLLPIVWPFDNRWCTEQQTSPLLLSLWIRFCASLLHGDTDCTLFNCLNCF